MSSRRQRRKTPQLSKISDILRELYYVSTVEKPRERIAVYEDLVPRMLTFARQTEDKKLVEIVEKFAEIEEQSRSFYEIEILSEKLSEFRGDLENALRFAPSEAINDLLACVNKFERRLTDTRRLAWSSVQTFSEIRDQLTRELIGRRLEKEIVPDMARKLGFDPCPNILPDNGDEVEVDFLGEKNSTTSPFGTGRLKTKSVLVVESKTTIDKSDIERFSRKLAIVKNKYRQHAENFRYDLKIEAWIFACYGWTKELRELANEKGIQPFGRDEIIRALKSNNLLDRRIPICP